MTGWYILKIYWFFGFLVCYKFMLSDEVIIETNDGIEVEGFNKLWQTIINILMTTVLFTHFLVACLVWPLLFINDNSLEE